MRGVTCSSMLTVNGWSSSVPTVQPEEAVGVSSSCGTASVSASAMLESGDAKGDPTTIAVTAHTTDTLTAGHIAQAALSS